MPASEKWREYLRAIHKQVRTGFIVVVSRLVVLLLVELRSGELVHVRRQLRGQIGGHDLVIEGRHHLATLDERFGHVR